MSAGARRRAEVSPIGHFGGICLMPTTRYPRRVPVALAALATIGAIAVPAPAPTVQATSTV
jgi:hypothetical protein